MHTESYKEAVVGIRMAVILKRYPEEKLNESQADLIQIKLLEAVDTCPLGEMPPQFLNSRFAQGAFWINCANEHSKVWLMRTISGLGELREDMKLTVVDSKDLPKRPQGACPYTGHFRGYHCCNTSEDSESRTEYGRLDTHEPQGH